MWPLGHRNDLHGQMYRWTQPWAQQVDGAETAGVTRKTKYPLIVIAHCCTRSAA